MRKQIGWVALWFGGSSYSHSYMSDDAEFFPTLKSARLEFVKRYLGWSTIRPVLFTRNSGIAAIAVATESTQTPAVDENSYMDLFPLWEDGETGEFAKRIEFGPRHGIRVTNA
jgi:hypothetical protein